MYREYSWLLNLMDSQAKETNKVQDKVELALELWFWCTEHIFQKSELPVLLDASVGRNAETAVSAGAEQAAVFAFELTAVDVFEIVLL